jgi:hypothetical protein
MQGVNGKFRRRGPRGQVWRHQAFATFQVASRRHCHGPREMNKVLTGDVGELLIGIDVHLRR